MPDTIIYIVLGLSVLTVIMLLLALRKRGGGVIDSDIGKELAWKLDGIQKRQDELKADVYNQLNVMRTMLESQQRTASDALTQRIEGINTTFESNVKLMRQLEMRLGNFSTENEQKLDNIRTSVSRGLLSIQEDNNKRLEEIRAMVDEKLQNTLDRRIAGAFNTVNERLEGVHKGLGEMKELASNVGDLKRVLTNVKTRGILGEIQLGAIISEVLSQEQYEANKAIKPNNRVEFAIKFPGDSGEPVYLPVDSKFPSESYQRLMDAYTNADNEAAKAASMELLKALETSAKDISDKYINPPMTANFAVMFLPTEGLYAEAVKLGMLERLRQKYSVHIAGPSTMAALLSSLQIGFKSYIIHKRGNEVWHVLSDVKKEFEKFSQELEKAQKHLGQASEDIDNLVGTRTRQMRKSLNSVTDVALLDASVAGDASV